MITVINLNPLLHIDIEPWGDRSILKKLIMECTYVHVQSNLNNIGVRQNMRLFMTVTSNLCINPNGVGVSFIIDKKHPFVLWRINT